MQVIFFENISWYSNEHKRMGYELLMQTSPTPAIFKLLEDLE